MKTISGERAPNRIQAIIHWFHRDEHQRHFVVVIENETIDDKNIFDFIESENKAVRRLWGSSWKETKLTHDVKWTEDGMLFIVTYIYQYQH